MKKLYPLWIAPLLQWQPFINKQKKLDSNYYHQFHPSRSTSFVLALLWLFLSVSKSVSVGHGGPIIDKYCSVGCQITDSDWLSQVTAERHKRNSSPLTEAAPPGRTLYRTQRCNSLKKSTQQTFIHKCNCTRTGHFVAFGWRKQLPYHATIAGSHDHSLYGI